MKIEDVADVARGLGHAERILLFGWWWHAHGGKATFMPADITKCYRDLHLAEPPGSLGPYFANLSKQGGSLLKGKDGYRLEGNARAAIEKKYAQPKTTVEISELLASLPAKLPTLVESEYLEEALRSYKANAPRAAIVMTWNLTYAHLCDHVVRHKLTDFNNWWQQQYKGDHKNGLRAITVATDFADEELGENKVLKICLDAGIITKNVFNLLHAALGKRNAAAHPNDVTFKQLHVDAYIDELITNGVLKIA